ncbi:MAG TPA: HD domain-containing phosphohydrolase [Candidatus Angelobacter sp.]|nr:HD domain-containing phosphohydrolase [Candidatus Angelobacter sp.]
MRDTEGQGLTATVLVADDEDASQRELRTLLERGGYRVITAGDGAAALRTLAAHECDLVLCAAVLPDMDGFEVCRAIKQAPATREIPVVLLMAGDDEVQRERAIQAGADDVAVKPVDRARLLALVRVQLRIAGLNGQLHKLESVVVTLARAVEDRDHTSAGLSEKVAHWAMQLGSALALPDDQLTLLYRAALLHDVGTVSVPVDVLSKQGRLDPGEFSQVKRHPIVGEEILAALPSAEQVLPAVRHHHERVDGAGYPDGLGGEDIPLFARIIAIADAFVAMSNDRPYRPRRPRDEVIRILRQGEGKQWDATLVERFLQLVDQADATSIPEAQTAG